MAWQSCCDPGADPDGYSIEGQLYASDGSVQGAQFEVNSYTTGDQETASVAAIDGGGFVVVWKSFGSSGTDTSSTSIQGQRYGVLSVMAVPALSPSAGLVLGATLMLLAAAALRRRAELRPRGRG